MSDFAPLLRELHRVPALAALLVDPRAGLGAGVLLLIAFASVLRWRKHSWAIGDRAFVVTGGLLNRRTWIVPFDKAQSISVHQGPLQRRLSLATLHVDTAGAPLLRAPEIVDMDSAEARMLAARLLSLFYQEKARTRGAR